MEVAVQLIEVLDIIMIIILIIDKTKICLKKSYKSKDKKVQLFKKMVLEEDKLIDQTIIEKLILDLLLEISIPDHHQVHLGAEVLLDD